eukprot:10427484-Prorocentrum_lima.AAC.1
MLGIAAPATAGRQGDSGLSNCASAGLGAAGTGTIVGERERASPPRCLRSFCVSLEVGWEGMNEPSVLGAYPVEE